MPNVDSQEFDGQAGRGQPPPAGFGGRYRTLGWRAGSQRLGMSLWEVHRSADAAPCWLDESARPDAAQPKVGRTVLRAFSGSASNMPRQPGQQK